ncbi:hypothetical protein FRB90_000422 [Tulasnella sp. 427]|nr:hypothetical protein FRB90_000422 [Tulasnella sp. 427]
MYQPTSEASHSRRMPWSSSYGVIPQAQAPVTSMGPSTYSNVYHSHWNSADPVYNTPSAEVTQRPPSLVVTGPSDYSHSLRQAPAYSTPGIGLDIPPQTSARSIPNSFDPLEYLLQESNVSVSPEGSPPSSYSSSPRSDITSRSPWPVQATLAPTDPSYPFSQPIHTSPATQPWGQPVPTQSAYSDQWLVTQPPHSYPSSTTDSRLIVTSQESSSVSHPQVRSSASPPPNSSGRELSLRERTRRKRRIDPSIIRSARFISSPLSSSHPPGPVPKRGPKRPEHDHVHITNLPCPNAGCSAPTIINDSKEGLVENFACTYLDPSNGRVCTSEFRRRGCRERHSGSHSGREAQDVTSGRISLGCARRVLWETIRLIEASDWGVVYSPPVPSNQLVEINWAQNYEEAGKQIAAEFNVDTLRQQAQAVRSALYELGKCEEQVQSDQKRITPVDLEQYQQFARLASKRATSFERFYCPHPTCEADFTRADALARHCRTCHEKDKGKKAKIRRQSDDGDTLA